MNQRGARLTLFIAFALTNSNSLLPDMIHSMETILICLGAWHAQWLNYLPLSPTSYKSLITLSQSTWGSSFYMWISGGHTSAIAARVNRSRRWHGPPNPIMQLSTSAEDGCVTVRAMGVSPRPSWKSTHSLKMPRFCSPGSLWSELNGHDHRRFLLSQYLHAPLVLGARIQ